MSIFETLNSVNVNEHTEKKNNLTYLSWAWAWAEVKKRFPNANYTIYENESGWNYHTDGRTCWVKTGVTIECMEHIEYLPVMDYNNKSIPLERVTSYDVNKAIQRSLTKAAARHGLGLYIYAGEDLPEGAEEPAAPTTAKTSKNIPTPPTATAKSAKPKSKFALIQDVLAERPELNINMVSDWIGKKFGKVIAINDLSDEQFNELYAALTIKKGA